MPPELIDARRADAATIRRNGRFWQVIRTRKRRLPATRLPLGGSAAFSCPTGASGGGWGSEVRRVETPWRDGLCAGRGAGQTRRRYSPVRVSISIRSPVLTNSGTWTMKPEPSLAGFITLPEVSPLTAGSV